MASFFGSTDNNEDLSSDAHVATGTLREAVAEPNADGPLTFSFTPTAEAELAALSLTSRNETLAYEVYLIEEERTVNLKSPSRSARRSPTPPKLWPWGSPVRKRHRIACRHAQGGQLIELFAVQNEVLQYNVTSTCFEGGGEQVCGVIVGNCQGGHVRPSCIFAARSPATIVQANTETAQQGGKLGCVS